MFCKCFAFHVTVHCLTNLQRIFLSVSKTYQLYSVVYSTTRDNLLSTYLLAMFVIVPVQTEMDRDLSSVSVVWYCIASNWAYNVTLAAI